MNLIIFITAWVALQLLTVWWLNRWHIEGKHRP